MKYESISWEGALIGPETLEKLSDENAIKGQKAGDFGLNRKIRDEIAEAWTEAKALWGLFCARREREDTKDAYGTSRTRNFWVVPFLELLGYQLENSGAREIAGKSFAISHRAAGYACPVHIVGFNESLDHRRDGSRASPHSLVQEYINLSDGLFALATNGLTLRLLRDSSRLVKLSYLEFNLERIFEEELFSDFALLFRLLHVSRWPRCDAKGEAIGEASDCLLEFYHQDSLENGSRIREKLSGAVVDAIGLWANGLLNHPANEAFRDSFRSGGSSPRALYDALLSLVYRVLFLLVIEERDLTHPREASPDLKALYRDYYSLASLRARCRGVWKEESRFGDLWESLVDTFSLYEDADRAEKLGLKPLAGDLFSYESFDLLRGLYMDNASFASGLNRLDSYDDEKRGVSVRVNYAALNVEEFGSIYEGLLEFDAQVIDAGSSFRFDFVKGEDRGKSGSHYTPEELVQPLIEHALEPLIEKCLKEKDAETRLLELKICDDACGSGHILLNAARRIALEVARLRTKADNPDPASYRRALREVIERCVYGVDFNPQAVRLCKVALWLESHNPGESLGFLDHHIKCGDSLVGLTQASELLEGIPEEAFAQRDGDDKDYASQLRSKHKEERKTELTMQIMTDWRTQVGDSIKTVIEKLKTVSHMPDSTPEEAALKKQTYLHTTSGEDWQRLKALADIQLSPFFIPKKPDNAIATEHIYRDFLNGREELEGNPIAEAAHRVAESRHFFHWFLEFAEVMQDGGFDCFLGNPPFLGGKKISTYFGLDYCGYLKNVFPEKGSSDLIGFFLRRNYNLLKQNRALGTLATNTIAQGGTREFGLEVIEKLGGSIMMAVRSRPWPGAAAVEVSLAVIYKGSLKGRRVLDGKPVSYISTYLDDQLSIGNPIKLAANADRSFVGSLVFGHGFVLEPKEVQDLIARNPKNKDVLFPYLNGEDLNSRSDQTPSRWIINMRDWPYDRQSSSSDYKGPVATDYPDCLEILKKRVKPQRDTIVAIGKQIHEYNYWKFWDRRDLLYRTIAPLDQVMVHTRVTKTHGFSLLPSTLVFSDATVIVASMKYAIFACLNSSLHEFWAWKTSSTMKGDRRYSCSDSYETFPFPPGFNPSVSSASSSPLYDTLDSLGSRLDTSRREIMLRLDIGLTKLYNLYHTHELDIAAVVKESKSAEAEAAWAIEKILALRELHKAIDEAVRDAYGWKDIALQHGFHELEFLPENDRVRYTISNQARKLVLQELLKLNHERHAQEVAAGLVDEKGKVIRKKEGVSKPLKNDTRKDRGDQQGMLL